MKFTNPVIRELKYYVYIYSHPITDEIFYVGKGVACEAGNFECLIEAEQMHQKD